MSCVVRCGHTMGILPDFRYAHRDEHSGCRARIHNPLQKTRLDEGVISGSVRERTLLLYACK